MVNHYIKQLDGLRGIAVLLVIFSHWLPPNNILNKIPNGAVGVDIFFVLSGFLISRILFEARKGSEESGVSKFILVKHFVIRRALRILPIYYLLLIILYIFSNRTSTEIANSFIYYASFTSNFYFYFTQEWDGMLSHFWSLAVEEQFYLVWPWLLLFINNRHLLNMILLTIGFGIGSEYLVAGVKMGSVLPNTCMDAFGLGALLAWVCVYKEERFSYFYKICSILAGICFLFFLFGLVKQEWSFLPLRTIVAFMTVWLIAHVLHRGQAAFLGIRLFLNSSILNFLGTISYGMYLYHNIIPSIVHRKVVSPMINPYLPEWFMERFRSPLVFIEKFLILLLISWLSYITVERFFLKWKSRWCL